MRYVIERDGVGWAIKGRDTIVMRGYSRKVLEWRLAELYRNLGTDEAERDRCVKEECDRYYRKYGEEPAPVRGPASLADAVRATFDEINANRPLKEFNEE